MLLQHLCLSLFYLCVVAVHLENQVKSVVYVYSHLFYKLHFEHDVIVYIHNIAFFLFAVLVVKVDVKATIAPHIA